MDHVKGYPHLVWSPHKLRVVLRQCIVVGRVQKNLGQLRPEPCVGEVADRIINCASLTVYHAKFGRFRSNGESIHTVKHPRFGADVSCLSGSLKVVKNDTVTSGSMTSY